MSPPIPNPSNLSCEPAKKRKEFLNEKSNPHFPNKKVFLSAGVPVVNMKDVEDDTGSFDINKEGQEPEAALPNIEASRKIKVDKVQRKPRNNTNIIRYAPYQNQVGI